MKPFSYWSYRSLWIAYALEIPLCLTSHLGLCIAVCVAQITFVLGLFIGTWNVKR